MSRIEFPLKPIKIERGIVPEPIIPVEVETVFGFRVYDFLVDSGADSSLLPFSMMKLLGVKKNECKATKTFGIEGSGVTTFDSIMNIRLNKKKLAIRCSISARDDVPFILGRLDLFYHYSIIFDNKFHKIIFERAR